MPFDSRSVAAAPEREIDGRREPRQVGTRVWSSLVAHNNAAKENIARIARIAPAIEADVMPRSPPMTVSAPSVLPTLPADEVANFVQRIMGDSEPGSETAVVAHRQA